MRLGKMEKLILLHIATFRESKNKTYSRHSRHEIGVWAIPLVYVRNRIFGTAFKITSSNKASFSRALRRLEEKGLIETFNYAGYGQSRYSTHAWLTPRVRALTEEGERLTFTDMFEKLTSISSNGTVSEEGV